MVKVTLYLVNTGLLQRVDIPIANINKMRGFVDIDQNIAKNREKGLLFHYLHD